MVDSAPSSLVEQAEAVLYEDVERAAQLARAAAEQARLSGDLADQIRAGTLLAICRGQQGRNLESVEGGLSLLEAAQALSDPALQSRLHNVLGANADVLGLTDRALRHFDQAVALLEESDGDRWTMFKVETNIGVVLSRTGDDAGALAHFGRALALAESLGRGHLVARTQIDAAISLRRLGRLDECERELAKAQESIRESRHHRTLPHALVAEAELRVDRGELDAALSILDEAVTASAGDEQPALIAAASALRSSILRRQGDFAEAIAAAREGLAAAQRQDADEWHLTLTEELSACLEAAGDLAEALSVERRLRGLSEHRLNRRLANEVAVLRVEHEVGALRREREALAAERQSLAEANASLRMLSREKSEFMAIASHDLRSPLTALEMLASVLDDADCEPGRQREIGSRLHILSARMDDIIGKLLDSHALETGNHRLEQAAVPLFEAVERVASGLLTVAESKGIQLEVDGDTSLVAQCDPSGLDQVVANLVDNALKFTPPGGRVSAQVSMRDGQGEVAVSDTGPGLTEDDLHRAFGKFARLSAKPTGQEPSTGLGLYIVRRVARAMGGGVTAGNAPAGGALFTLHLPLYTPSP